MENTAGFAQKWGAFWHKAGPVFQKISNIFGKICDVVEIIFLWLYRLRGLFMAVPVAYAALKLAEFNAQNLPEQVGLDILSSGEFGHMVERSIAVNGPVEITAICLVVMLFSRRPLFPWIIAVFTLVLPILLLMMNNLDALLVLLRM